MSKLTGEFVDGLKADGTDQWHRDPGVAGLALRVTPQGAKIWLVRKRVQGKLKKRAIGTFPEMTPAAARREAALVLHAFAVGKDPVAERAERQRADSITVAALYDRWMTEQVRVKRKPRTVRDYEGLFAKHILPALGSTSITALSWEDVSKLHASMANSPRQANYTVATLRALLNYAERLKLRPFRSNPARDIEFFREGVRERFLTEFEIGMAAGAIAGAEQDGKIGPHAAAGLRLALFTGARSGEITAAEWTHVDWERRLIRLPDSKTNRPRTIHLSDAALEVLQGLPRVGRYVIAGAKPDEAYKNLSRAWIIARERVGLNDVRLHDLRHSYASLAVTQGVSLRMVGELLGHRVAATTMRYAHLARDAAAAVNDELGAAMAAAIAKGTPQPASVIKLKPRRGRKPRV
jgi:integrase